MSDQPQYPYQDGDVTVLGPEIFASKGGAVICWKGENYIRPQDIPPRGDEMIVDALHELACGVRDLASSVRLENADRLRQQNSDLARALIGQAAPEATEEPPPAADEPSPADEARACTDACRDVPGIRGLLEHVGIDTRGRDITVDGRVVDTAQPAMSITGYCPACGRGDAAPTAEDWEQQRQRADRAEAELRDRVHADSGDAAAGSYAHRAEQAEELLRIAHETSNRSEAERARAVQRAEQAEHRLRLAHQARRGKEQQLDGIRRALCDVGVMQDDDPYSHADLEDVIRQAFQPPAPAATEQQAGRLCGLPHYDYPETVCTHPAGHYQRDRDPHAGPLIVNGREIGAAAWDEPKPPAHNAGPTVTECRDADRRWPLEKAGE